MLLEIESLSVMSSSLKPHGLWTAPWTLQLPGQSMEFFKPEHWSGYLFPSPGDLPKPEIKPRSPTLQVDSLPAESQGKPKNTGVGGLHPLHLLPDLGIKSGIPALQVDSYQLSY